jgi:uncharacterized protein HemX
MGAVEIVDTAKAASEAAAKGNIFIILLCAAVMVLVVGGASYLIVRVVWGKYMESLESQQAIQETQHIETQHIAGHMMEQQNRNDDLLRQHMEMIQSLRAYMSGMHESMQVMQRTMETMQTTQQAMQTTLAAMNERASHA